MDIEQLKRLVLDAAEDKFSFDNGATSSNGYGFIFKDLNSKIPYVTINGSSKLFGVGSHRDFTKNFRKFRKIKKIQNFDAKRILAVTHGKFLATFCQEFLGKELDKEDDCCLLEVEIKGKDVKFISASGLSFKK